MLGHVFNIQLVRFHLCLYLYFLLEQSLKVRPRLCQVSLGHKHRPIHVCGFIASQEYVWALQRLCELRISQLFLLSFCGLPIFCPTLLFLLQGNQSESMPCHCLLTVTPGGKVICPEELRVSSNIERLASGFLQRMRIEGTRIPNCLLWWQPGLVSAWLWPIGFKSTVGMGRIIHQ